MGRRRRRPREAGVFESINITPFTDVLLVLLIIFLIAGSSFSPGGVPVDKLSSGSVVASGELNDEAYTLYVGEAGELFLHEGEERRPVEIKELMKERAVYLTAAPTTASEKVVFVYDQLLREHYPRVYLSAPLD